MQNLNSLKRPELLALAKSKGLHNYSKLKVDELRVMLGATDTKHHPKKPSFSDLKLSQLFKLFEGKHNLTIKEAKEKYGALTRESNETPTRATEEQIFDWPKVNFNENKEYWRRMMIIEKVGMTGIEYILRKNKRDQKEIESLRALVAKDLEGIKLDSVELLEKMFQSYDRHFFMGRLAMFFAATGSHLNFRWAPKLTTTAGTCALDEHGTRCSITLSVSSHLVKNLFSKGEKSHSANGHLCRTKLECIQQVFEHELIHAIIMAGKDYDEVHGQKFKDIALSQFGHKTFRHSFYEGEGEEVISRRAKSFDIASELKKGTKVIFVCKDKKLNGKIGVIFKNYRKGSASVQVSFEGKVYRFPIEGLKLA